MRCHPDANPEGFQNQRARCGQAQDEPANRSCPKSRRQRQLRGWKGRFLERHFPERSQPRTADRADGNRRYSRCNQRQQARRSEGSSHRLHPLRQKPSLRVSSRQSTGIRCRPRTDAFGIRWSDQWRLGISNERNKHALQSFDRSHPSLALALRTRRSLGRYYRTHSLRVPHPVDPTYPRHEAYSARGQFHWSVTLHRSSTEWKPRSEPATTFRECCRHPPQDRQEVRALNCPLPDRQHQWRRHRCGCS